MRLRVLLLTVLVLAVFGLQVTAKAEAFSDVPASHAYADAVEELSSLGIVNGYTNGQFGLVDPVKQAQFAKMIVGTLGLTPTASTSTRFTDLGTPDAQGYPLSNVQKAYENGTTNGTNTAQTLFAPWSSIRRDQVVSMIVRGAGTVVSGALETPPAGTPSVFSGVPQPHGANLRVAEYNGLLDGLMGIGPGWQNANATRGEVAQVLHNALALLEQPTVPVVSGPGLYDISSVVDPSSAVRMSGMLEALSRQKQMDLAIVLLTATPEEGSPDELAGALLEAWLGGHAKRGVIVLESNSGGFGSAFSEQLSAEITAEEAQAILRDHVGPHAAERGYGEGLSHGLLDILAEVSLPAYLKVLVLNYDPPVTSSGGKRLSTVLGFNDPRELADAYIADLMGNTTFVKQRRPPG